MGITTSNPPFSAAVFQMVYGAQPVLVGPSPTYWDLTLGTLPSDWTATRASSGYYYNSSGVLVSASTDVPRFTYQYNGTSWVADGLLVEGPSTNMLLRSEDFSNATWQKFRASISADTAVAPDGTTTADSLIEDTTASNSHTVGQTWTSVSGTTYAISVFAKANTRNWLAFDVDSTQFGLREFCYFNVAAGAGAVGTNSITNSRAYIVDVGNGWYRCVVIKTATASSAGTTYFRLATGNGVSTYTGDGTSGLYLWGANSATGDALTSYIKTTTATVARASDEVRITNANALVDQCFVVKSRVPRKLTGGAVNVALQVDDGSTNNKRSLRYGTDMKGRVLSTYGGVDQCDLDMGTLTGGNAFSEAARFADNNFAASVNGGAIVTDTSGTNPLGMTTARVGSGASGNYWNGAIRVVEMLRTATDAELPLLAA